MKLICPKCQYKGFVDASADEGVTCARCGTPMDQLLWTGSQLSPLTTAAAAAASAAVVDQRIMENHNLFAPTTEHSGDDVLEIPRPVQPAEHTGEQMLVLEDVIAVPPAPDLSSTAWEEEAAPTLQAQDDAEENTLWLEEDEETIVTSRVVPGKAGEAQASANVLGSSQASSSAPDYDGYRAWVRMAPLLLLLGALVFFTLYYLGNRMGSEERAQNAATNPAPTAETASSTTAATAPQNVESAAAPATQPAESSVGAKAESPAPEEKTKVETAKQETPRPAAAETTTTAAPASAAPPSTPAVAPPTPSVEQGTGNYTVQVGSYNNAAQAEERAGQLSSSGIEARVVRAEIPRRGTWYRVQAGRFASQEEAARFGAQLKGKGATDDFIITGVQSQ